MSRYAHPAGPRHADGTDHGPSWLACRRRSTRSTRRSGRPRPSAVDGVLTVGGLRRTRPRRASTAPRPTSSTRTTSVPGAAAFREAFGPTPTSTTPARRSCAPTVARWIDEEGLGLDVCTGGELAVALRAGFPPERIALHGNNKSRRRARPRPRRGGRPGRRRLASTRSPGWPTCAEERGRRPRVLVRVTVGVEAHTHEFIATAHEDQKFGFSLASGAAPRRVGGCSSRRRSSCVGLHSHIGSQIFDTAGLRGRGAPASSACWRRSATSTASSCPSSTSVAASASPTPATTTPSRSRSSPPASSSRRGDARGRAVRAAAVGRARSGDRRPGAVTVYEVGTVKDGRPRRRRQPPLRVGRRRDERQHPHRALRRRPTPACSPRGPRRAAGARPGWSASTARAATSSCATPGCPPTSRRAT